MVNTLRDSEKFFCRRDFANEQQNLLFNFEEITESSLAKLKSMISNKLAQKSFTT